MLRSRIAFPLSTRLASLLLDIAYLLLLVLLSPWLLFMVLVRRRGVGSIAERLGFIAVPAPDHNPDHRRVWIHAVSVGELEAALPLIDALGSDEPATEIVISTTTATAHAVAERRLPLLTRFYYPVDLGFCVRSAIKRAAPDLIVLMELEIWPNLVLHASAAGIPLVVANGRVSPRGHQRMSRVRLLLRPFLRRVSCFLVQSEEYQERLLSLGVASDRIEVAGNLKLDRIPLDRQELRAAFDRDWGGARELRWIAGCTHPGEEQPILETHRQLREEFPGLVLILAPRHVERSGEVEGLVTRSGFEVRRFTAGPDSSRELPSVLLVDVTGELAQLYACADVAFVGGSLIERGGHNVLEPILAGTPVIHGPHCFNFRHVVELLSTGRGAVQVADGQALLGAVRTWLRDPAERSASLDRARDTIERHRGAAQRSLVRVRSFLDQ